ncbi:hypothetical protein OG225_32500 [Nocardia sp. NBC_01377]|uniref:hypothetical protein n=1 Tax=Nocardia sp. NBC_01377 TaxID=2903595 RepID=UPI003253028A
MRIFLVTAAVVALPILSACGSDSATEPPALTAADLSRSLQDKGLRDKDLADCAAALYVSEGISQQGLRTMTGDEYDNKTADPATLGMSKEDGDRARAANAKIATECLGK